MMDRVVLRYRDGRTERADLEPSESDREVLTVIREDGDRTEVPFSILKAVFYPRGETATPEPDGGMHINVEFSDGEVIRGVALYNPEKNGFLLYPHDRSKNDRVFVVNSAIVSIEVEKL